MSTHGTVRSPSVPGPSRRDGWSLIGLANVLLRNRRVVAGCALLASVVSVALGWLVPASAPAAVASFRGPGDLAAALGSEPALREALDEGDDPRAPGDPTAAAIARSTRVRLVAEPDLWELSVRTGRPELSLEVAGRLLAMDPARVVTGPEWEREWMEERLTRAWRELRAAEAALQRFADENPAWESSARLRAEHDRLEGRVELRRSLVYDAELDRAQAEMALARARPPGQGPGGEANAIRIVEPPALRETGGDGVAYLALLGLLAGLAVGILWALGREGVLRLGRGDPEAYAEFRRLLEESRRDVRRPWRAFFR